MNINGGFESLGILDLSHSTAVINMSSAIVNLSHIIYATASNATINIDEHSLLITPSGHNASEYFANINNSGIIHQAGSALDISSAYSIYGIGSISDHVNCQGSLSATSGYTITLNGGLNLSGTGAVNLRTGNLYVNDAISGMDGGTLNANNQYIGSTGSGTFTHTDGTSSIANSLYLGNSSTASGNYYLSGSGQLFATGEYIGDSGTGTFTHTGGTNSVSGYMYLGHDAGINGTYNLSDAGQLSASTEVIGNSGTGTFNHTGGTNSVTNNLYLGFSSNSNGTYNLSDAGQLIAPSEWIGYYSNATGTFKQTGGTNTVTTNLSIGRNGGSGKYTLSGDGHLSALQEEIGATGTGIFEQNGGTNTTTALKLSVFSGSSGTYNLNGGTLILKSLSTNYSSTAFFNFGGGTLQANADFSVIQPMTLITLTGNGGNANIDTAGHTVTLYPVLDGPGGLNKLGSGTLTLRANNSYKGNTYINAGKLALTSAGLIASTPIIDILSEATFDVSAKSNFSLGATQTLMGSGTVLGNFIAASGSHIAPGNSAGTLTLSGNLTLNDGALLDFELASISNSDMISMGSSTLYLNNQDFYDFNFAALSGFGKGIYTLIDAGTISGNLGSKLTGAIGGFSATLSKSGNDLVLNVVPEPGAWMLLAAAYLGLFVRKRLRRTIGLDEG